MFAFQDLTDGMTERQHKIQKTVNRTRLQEIVQKHREWTNHSMITSKMQWNVPDIINEDQFVVMQGGLHIEMAL